MTATNITSHKDLHARCNMRLTDGETLSKGTHRLPDPGRNN